MSSVGPSIAAFIDVHPANAGIAFRYGELLAKRKERRSAAMVRRVLELDPRDERARHKADVLRLRTGSSDDDRRQDLPRN